MPLQPSSSLISQPSLFQLSVSPRPTSCSFGPHPHKTQHQHTLYSSWLGYSPKYWLLGFRIHLPTLEVLIVPLNIVCIINFHLMICVKALFDSLLGY